MITNNKQLERIVKLSPIKPSIQNGWKTVSNSLIHKKIIQPLTYIGLLQAIDNVAYNIYINSKLCVELGLTDAESDELLDSNIHKMEEIIRVIALASGIHPTTIDLMIGFRTDYYTDNHVAISSEE